MFSILNIVLLGYQVAKICHCETHDHPIQQGSTPLPTHSHASPLGLPFGHAGRPPHLRAETNRHSHSHSHNHYPNTHRGGRCLLRRVQRLENRRIKRACSRRDYRFFKSNYSEWKSAPTGGRDNSPQPIPSSETSSPTLPFTGGSSYTAFMGKGPLQALKTHTQKHMII